MSNVAHSVESHSVAQDAAGARTAIDLFAGCGGLSIGLGQAGFTVEAAVEIDADACTTFAGLHNDAELFDGDIATVDFRQFRGDVRLVGAGVPCQPFSSGGKRLAAADPRVPGRARAEAFSSDRMAARVLAAWERLLAA